ncbi:erythromycin esterase family protein [Flavobacterium hauense]
MKKKAIVFFILLSINSVWAQVEKNTYELGSMESLLTNDVKGVLNVNLKDKRVVFLGESGHFVGSDFLAKTQFVKYLVLEKGYKDIAFEDDFFALYFDHNKTHLHSFWSNSIQCSELFEFLRENNVTIWGFDNQIYSQYTKSNFLEKLTEFLNANAIDADKDFIRLTDTFFRNASELGKTDGKQNIEKILSGIDTLLKNDKVIQDKLWVSILESYKSFVMIVSTHKGKEKGTPVRDAQMAKNLDFLVKTMPEKKFIVWLHNAHMAKYEYIFVPGETMGGQFVKANPGISYNIAVSSIHLFYRKPKQIEKYGKDKENLLHFLPTTEKNYFIDSDKVIFENPEYANKEYDGMFNLEDDNKSKTNWFKHYDALVFISKGEEVTYPEKTK